jgi:hypothetical protein
VLVEMEDDVHELCKEFHAGAPSVTKGQFYPKV